MASDQQAPTLAARLRMEADLCANENADDIAALLNEAAAALAALAGPLEQPQEPTSDKGNLAQASGVCDLQAALPDTGDHVHHAPSDEDWVVAYVRVDKLCACGWPCTLADLSDCTIIKKATPAERHELLLRMADMDGGDSRGAYARERLSRAACEARAGAVPSDKPAASSESSVSVPKERE